MCRVADASLRVEVVVTAASDPSSIAQERSALVRTSALLKQVRFHVTDGRQLQQGEGSSRVS